MTAMPSVLATSLTWDPPFHGPEAVAVALVALGLGAWLAWRGVAEIGGQLRRSLALSRTLGFTCLAVFWLNPGRWHEEPQAARREWQILLDRSASMQTPEGATTRWQAATNVAERLGLASGPAGDVRIRPFSSRLEAETAAPATLTADGDGTALGAAVSEALDQRFPPLAGLVVISDGRQSMPADLEEIALRARGRGVPIHAVALGASASPRDLVLTASPRRVTSFQGQPVKLSAQIENRGLGPIKPTIELLGPDETVLARQEVVLENDARQTVVFDVKDIPAGGGDYQLRAAPWPGEDLRANNTDTVRINVLASKTRILLLEGAPYWDSKFLAQLLRQENAVDLLTIHRLNDERYFRVEANGAEPLQSPASAFPENAAELSRYDLVVFGKGADNFLTPARIAALEGFVRDQGGAVLFARGKPYSGRFAPLEALEPVEWGEAVGGGFRFTPLPDVGAGLFGAALPPAEDRVWATLPLLEDVHDVARLKPFTRTLAEGAAEKHDARLPLLLVRRFGRGTVATVNADGLWRWDFRPEIRAESPVYQQFWVQLMQWCATWSEFQPGEDYAVRLRDTATRPGQPARAIISYRGPAAPEPQPHLRWRRLGKSSATDAAETTGEAAATPLTAPDGRREWIAVAAPGAPGRYELRVADAGHPGREEGQVILTVPAPLGEADDLRPDLESLTTLAHGSGGEVFTPAEVEKLAASLWTKTMTVPRNKPEWEPLWPRPWAALLAACAFGLEWWFRRREGLL